MKSAANLFKVDTIRNWNSRPRDMAVSDSGTLQVNWRQPHTRNRTFKEMWERRNKELIFFWLLRRAILCYYL